MARVTVEDCVMKVPNRFDLVMLASQRARDLAAGATMTLDRDNDKNPVVALREIAEDKVDLTQLNNLIVKGLQKVPDVDEPEDEPEGDVAEIMAAATSIVSNAGIDDEDISVIDGDEDLSADLVEDTDELA
jgi:DNA-directed RNA polymerase subunit omega